MKFLNAFLFLILLASCAKVVPPSGGEKDTTPPQWIGAIPPNESLNFQSESIYLEFDEFVQLNDIQNQLIVSPPLEERPNIRIKKRGVLIELKEKLKPSTTYTFNFGAGVGDFTENNSAKDLIYVISTGNVLDSLQIQGEVIDAYTGLPSEGAKVMFYRELQDSIPLKEKPYYFGRSNAEGKFKVSNMSEGEYKVFVLQESNSNYIYDDPSSESYAYLQEPIASNAPSDSLSTYRFRLSQERDTLQYFQDYYTDSTGFAQLVYFQKPLSPTAKFIDAEGEFRFDLRRNQDTTYFWIAEPPTNQDREVVFFDQGKILDTLSVKHYEVSGEQSKERYQLLLTKEGQKSLRVEDTLRFGFNRPISSVDTSLFLLVKDSLEVSAELSVTGFEVMVKGPFQDGESYDLLFLPGAIESREGMLLKDSISSKVQFMTAEELGDLNLVLPFETSENDIIELLRKEGGVVVSEYVNGRNRIQYSRLKPGVYRFRLFEDKNRNGKWDAAEYFKGIQPEMVYNYQEDIQLRANWEMEIVWNLLK